MKRQWTTAELVDHFTVHAVEFAFLANKEEATRLGCAVLLKTFQYEGRFPAYRREVPDAIVASLATQLDLDVATYATYAWKGRTIGYHRAQIRTLCGFREVTTDDVVVMTTWLCAQVVPHDCSLDHLKTLVYQRFRTLSIEPPTPDRIDRLIRSARHAYEDQFYTTIMNRLSFTTHANLDAVLVTTTTENEVVLV